MRTVECGTHVCFVGVGSGVGDGAAGERRGSAAAGRGLAVAGVAARSAGAVGAAARRGHGGGGGGSRTAAASPAAARRSRRARARRARIDQPGPRGRGSIIDAASLVRTDRVGNGRGFDWRGPFFDADDGSERPRRMRSPCPRGTLPIGANVQDICNFCQILVNQKKKILNNYPICKPFSSKGCGFDPHY
ncbi:unnamed protein product, partial [Iphiclides podalirius]